MFVSYAQNFEDVMLHRIFGSEVKGFYIDVGAWHPDLHSVTKHFYENGWSGVNVEPSSSYYEILRKHRARDVNLNVAIGIDGGNQDFVEVPGSGLSSLKPEAAVRANRFGFRTRRCKVPVVTLQSICEQYCSGKEVCFIKIDVEGGEHGVIASLDWRAHRPIVVLVEAVNPDSFCPTWEAWEPVLLTAGYTFVWFDGLNRYYVRNESVELRKHFVVPPSLADGFVVESNHPLCMRPRTKIRLASRGLLPSGIYKLLMRVYDFSKG